MRPSQSVAYTAFMVADICDDVAAIAYPLPDREEMPDGAYDGVWERREHMAAEERQAWEEAGRDPVLARLDFLRGQLLEVEQEIRLFLAYGREFTHPRPYRLIDLAGASGMSISGVRTAYDEAEVEEVAQRIGPRPRSRISPTGQA